MNIQFKYFACNMRIICLAVTFCVIFEAREENAQDLNSGMIFFNINNK